MAEQNDPLAGFAYDLEQTDVSAREAPVVTNPLEGLAYEPIPERNVISKISAAAQGATTGFVEAAPVVAGAVAGGEIGAVAGAATGPFAPIAVPVGAAAGIIIGGIAGYMAGDTLTEYGARVTLPGTDQTLTFADINSVPPDLRPWAVGGETVGQTIPFAAAPFAAATQGFRFSGGSYKVLADGTVQFNPALAPRVLNSMIETAATMPATFAAGELSSAISAGVGAGYAEQFYPGQAGPRFVGELAGGVMNPARWVLAAGRNSLTIARNFYIGRSPTAQESVAGAYIRETLTQLGDDPEAVIAALRNNKELLADFELTAGQKSGSRAMLELEAKLINLSSQFGAESRDRAESALLGMRVMMNALSESGDPQALRVAAQIRNQYFTALLSTRLQDASMQVMETARIINPSNSTSMRDFGVRAGEILTESMEQVRGVESGLWEAVDNTIPLDSIDNFTAAVAKIRSQRLPEEGLPSIVERFISRKEAELEQLAGGGSRAAREGEDFGAGLRAEADEFLVGRGMAVPGEAVPEVTSASTTGEMILFRSRMLALSREAAAKNDWDDARVYGVFAEAALDDLQGAVGGIDPAFDAAREYSRVLNETFSQTFAGNALRRTAEGGERLPPELIMRRAFGSGQEIGELQFRQLQEAATMAGNEYVSRLLQVQESTLRAAAGEVIDTATGRVNADRLANFVRKNEELLNRFPQLRTQLADAETAERFLRSTESGVARARNAINSQAAFARVIGGEDPSTYVQKVLSGENPARDLLLLQRLAIRGGPDAQEGLAASVFSVAYDRATSAAGDFSFRVYKQIFDAPVTPGGPPLRDVLLHSGIVKASDLKQMDAVLERAGDIEQAMARHDPVDNFLNRNDPMFDFVLRIMGAKFGALAPTGGAHALIVQSAGSRVFRQIFDRVPRDKVRDIILKAVRDPQMMADLLESAPTPQEQLRLGLNMNAYLWQAGVMGWSDEDGVR